MKCEICRGACCEVFELGHLEVRFVDQDHRRWLELHTIQLEPVMRFNCRCQALTEDGRCAIYFNRPLMCATYPAGGKDCLATVKTRRTLTEYAKIRDIGDPETI